MGNRILVVDDDRANREVVSVMLRQWGHETELAVDGFDALARVRLDVDLVLLDVTMPGMDGFEVARRIRQDDQVGDVPIIMVTALAGRQDRLRAVQAGANDFVAKPIDWVELKVRTESQLKIREAQQAAKRHQQELEMMVQRRTESLREALAEVVQAQRQAYEAHLDTIQRLVLAAEYKDRGTASHIRRMGRLCALLAEALDLPPGQVEVARVAGPMHDVGKIGIPDAILLKPGKLTDEEWAAMKEHSAIGARILEGSPSELLQAGRSIALSHHERWDGTGYPHGLVRESIPLFGRICAVADVFDALTSDRPYRPALPFEEAVATLTKGRGTHFDPQIVDSLLQNLEAVRTILRDSDRDG